VEVEFHASDLGHCGEDRIAISGSRSGELSRRASRTAWTAGPAYGLDVMEWGRIVRIPPLGSEHLSGAAPGEGPRLWSLRGLSSSWYGSPRGAAGSILITALVGAAKEFRVGH